MDVIETAKEKMGKTIAVLVKELSSLRAGRANAQVLDRIAFRHIRPLHRKAHAQQYLCQRTHRHTADTNQMDAFAWNQIIADRGGMIHHRKRTSFQTRLHIAMKGKALYNF